MADSPSHRFGQIIGEVLEAAVWPLLATFADKHGLYLDRYGDRPCRPSKSCTWLDLNNNKHDLDFVLERGGSDHQVGIPAAFIETAWRRYTKHSRNKAQEIQGAIIPLTETYRNARPFIGVILAGVFTEGSLAQLRSLGFSILYFSYESVLAAFSHCGIDARTEENTPDAAFADLVAQSEALGNDGRAEIARRLLLEQEGDVDAFMTTLERAISRQIDRVTVLPLYGMPEEWASIGEAIRYLETYHESASGTTLQRFEIRIRYNNADSVEAEFGAKEDAVAFLKTYLPVPIQRGE